MFIHIHIMYCHTLHSALRQDVLVFIHIHIMYCHTLHSALRQDVLVFQVAVNMGSGHI